MVSDISVKENVEVCQYENHLPVCCLFSVQTSPILTIYLLSELLYDEF